MARKLSANYVVFALEPCIRSEQYSQLGIEKIVEKICGVATSKGQKRIVSVDQNDPGVDVKFGHEFAKSCTTRSYLWRWLKSIRYEWTR